MQLGHQPRRWHEKATALLSPQSSHLTPHETIIQNAALEVGAQLLLDVVRQLVLVRARALQKSPRCWARTVEVERVLFRLTAAV